MTPSFINLVPTKFSGSRTQASKNPSLTFGVASPAVQERDEVKDEFVRQKEDENLEKLDFDIDTDGLDGTPPVDSPDIAPIDEEDPEEDENPATRLLKNTRRFEAPVGISPVIQSLRENTVQQVHQVLSRSHLNSVELSYDEPKVKDGVLAQLHQDLGDTPMLVMDCDGIEPKKNGGFFSKDKTECQLLPTIQRIIPQLEEKFAFSEKQDQPIVIVLDNVQEDELEDLQDSEVYQAFQKQHPNIRFIIPIESDADDSNSSSSSPWKQPDPSNTKWRWGQFQVVNIPSLNPQEWAKVFKQDPVVEMMLNFWHLKASDEVLTEFFGVLKREEPNKPLTYDDLIAEFDSLGSFVNSEKKESHTLTSRDIKSYSHRVLAPRRGRVPTAGGPANVGPAPYDLINSGDINVQMDDIVGHDDAKKILMQALKESKYPEFFNYLNDNDPDSSQSAVLLMGEPGGGKTMLAKAVASAGGATFISTSGSRFVNGLVGGGANAIRRLRDGIEQAPDDLVVVFIDEIDALGSRSGMSGEMGASGSEDLKTINEFLAFTDGVKRSNKRILLVGATNRPEALDKAILSRFTYKVECKPMDRKQRQVLIEKQLEQKNLHPDDTVSLKSLARRTHGFSGRDIKNLMKTVKDKMVGKITDEELEHLEQDAGARETFKLQPSHRDLVDGIREVKKGWDTIDENEDSKAFSGGKDNKKPRQPYTITG